jgi:hypothetical protein
MSQQKIMDHTSAFEAMNEDTKDTKAEEKKVLERRDLLLFDLDSYRYKCNNLFNKLSTQEQEQFNYLKNCKDFGEAIEGAMMNYFDLQQRATKKDLRLNIGDYKETLEFLNDFCNRHNLDCSDVPELDELVLAFFDCLTPDQYTGTKH